MGFVDEIKGIFQEKTVMGMGYAVASGLASGVLGALIGRYTKSKWGEYLGYIVGSAGMAYVADKWLKHPEWKGYAYFGGLFPPVWELVTDKISPDDLANKVGASLGLTWEQAAMSTYAPAQPVTLTVTPVAPAQPAPAPVEEEFLY